MQTEAKYSQAAGFSKWKIECEVKNNVKIRYRNIAEI